MSDLEIFTQDFSENGFENKSRANGFTFWYASELMALLGYETWTSFQKAINKALTTCNTLNIDIPDNFIFEQREVGGKNIRDVKLSRFACYLVVMNADNKKPTVAKAQVYFANLAGAVQSYLEEADKVERLGIREEISDRENSLSGTARRAGVQQYSYFQNAGYRGMYNKNINQLRELRGIEGGRSPLDYMGKVELAANLFRITQTEMKIQQNEIKGQSRLESAAESVGGEVRSAMIRMNGIAPENLPVGEDIREIKKQLKQKSKQIKGIDSKVTPSKKKK